MNSWQQLRRRLFGVNYFFRLATIIFPYQRQLLLRRRGAPPPRWRAQPAERVFGFERAKPGSCSRSGLGKWETCFWFSTFPDRFARAVGMWKSRRRLARFPRGSWKEWEACFWLSTLSTAPAFPQLPPASFFRSCRLTFSPAPPGPLPAVSSWPPLPDNSEYSAR